VFVFFFVLLMLLFPIGIFAGVCGAVVSAICGTVPEGGKATLSADTSWFCSGARWWSAPSFGALALFACPAAAALTGCRAPHACAAPSAAF
jgi:hypothetical protein